MVRAWPLDVCDLTNRRFCKPRKLFEGHEQFATGEIEPKTVAGNVGDLNLRSGGSRLSGFCCSWSRMILTRSLISRSGSPCDSKGNLRRKPELGLAIGRSDVNVNPALPAGEEEKPIRPLPKDRRAHDSMLPRRPVPANLGRPTVCRSAAATAHERVAHSELTWQRLPSAAAAELDGGSLRSIGCIRRADRSTPKGRHLLRLCRARGSEDRPGPTSSQRLSCSAGTGDADSHKEARSLPARASELRQEVPRKLPRRTERCGGSQRSASGAAAELGGLCGRTLPGTTTGF